MTFVFQDSTEIPIQKNFIDDLNNFLDLIEKILPIENNSIELNNQIKNEDEKFTEETYVMEKFIAEFDEFLDDLSKKYTLESAEKCKAKLKESGTACIEKQKEQLKFALDDLTRRSKDEVAQMAEQIRLELEPFLWSRVYNVNKTQLIMGNDNKLKGTIKMNINGFSYTYETLYADNRLQIKKFIKEISIPLWSRGGLIHKEDRIKNQDISEYIIKRIYVGEDFQLDLENKKGTKKINIRVPGEIKHASLMYIKDEPYDISGDDDLLSQLDFDNLEKLIQKIKQYIENDANIVFKKLVIVEIDEKNAIAKNEMFECIKIIASQYGEIIEEIFSHSFTKNEIIIKEITENETRNEIFIGVEEISNRLSVLGGDGLELKDLLNL